MFSATLVENRLIINDSDAVSKIHRKRGFGDLIDEKLYLTVFEGLYLLERGMIKAFNDRRSLLRSLLNLEVRSKIS